MADPRNRGPLAGAHCAGGRNGMPVVGGYDPHLAHDSDDAAADEAVLKARELRELAMARLGVTQAEIDEARAMPQPRRTTRADVVVALGTGPER